jgi:hypothetical protein
MAESPHYKELLHILNECEVEYLIVGGVRRHEVHRTAIHHKGPWRVGA